jgi:hypothetical protein
MSKFEASSKVSHSSEVNLVQSDTKATCALRSAFSMAAISAGSELIWEKGFFSPLGGLFRQQKVENS